MDDILGNVELYGQQGVTANMLRREQQKQDRQMISDSVLNIERGNHSW